jgi:hypothetical protein
MSTQISQTISKQTTSKKATKVPKDIIEENEDVEKVYPTEWDGGFVSGSVKITENFCRITTQNNGKGVTKSFYWNKSENNYTTNENIYKSKKEAIKEAEKYKIKSSKEFGKTKNMWRQVDDDSVEIQTDSENTFYVDLKNQELISKYMCHTKKVHSKFHVLTKVDGNVTNVYKLVKPNIKYIEYIDANPLNLRESNLREAGAAVVCDKIENSEGFDLRYDINVNHNSYLKYVDLPYILPKNTFILGKPAGTVFDEPQYPRWTARVTTGSKYASKTFRYTDQNKNDVYNIAKDWQVNASYKLGLTRNLIKILDNKHIEVQITKENSIITDIALIPLIQKISLFTTECGGTIRLTKDPYCATSLNNKNIMYYNLITQNDMTDHINGDTLNNTMENLRPCTYSMNNSNRHYADDNQLVGYDTHDQNGSRVILSKIKVDKHVFTKYFYFTGYDHFTPTGDKIIIEPHNEKLQLQNIAFKYRRFVLYGDFDDILLPYIKHKDFRIVSKHFNRTIDHIKLNIINKQKYFSTFKTYGLEFTELEESLIYNLYYSQQLDHIAYYHTSIDNIAQILYINKKKFTQFDSNPTDKRQKEFEELSKIVHSKKGIILSDITNYKNSSSNITIKCKCGYKFNMNLISLRNNKFCYACNDNTKEGLTKKIIEKLTGKQFLKVKPHWLINGNGNVMEIDMYNDELKIGIEYNGSQHLNVGYHIKTDEKLQIRIQDDKIKNDLCKSHGINLITIHHDLQTEEDIKTFLVISLSHLSNICL